MAEEKHSRVISVRFKPGCYRHLKVPSDYTLEDFADAIVWAFNLDNDHAHAFFMNNQSWDNEDSYYMDFRDGMKDFETHRYTHDYKLDVLTLKQKFKFVFDFGDNLEFQCQYLRDEPDCEDCELIKEVGKAPEQYPDYDEGESTDNGK